MYIKEVFRSSIMFRCCAVSLFRALEDKQNVGDVSDNSESIASQVAKRRETVPNWAPDFNMHHDSISIEEDLGPTLLMEESEEDIPPAAVRDKVLVGHHRSPRNDQPLPRDKPTQVIVSYALYVFNAIP